MNGIGGPGGLEYDDFGFFVRLFDFVFEHQHRHFTEFDKDYYLKVVLWLTYFLKGQKYLLDLCCKLVSVILFVNFDFSWS
jgi:hypothetical protein